MPRNRVVERPIVLGIVGDSAAGKTTLTAGIAAILGAERVATICSDDYHRYDRKERARRKITALHPDCNHVDIMEQHLSLLRQGRPVLKPVYDHHDGTLTAPEYVEPKKPYVIVEGLLGYHTRAMRECYDVKVFLDPDEELRIRWKMQRDTAKRGYDRAEVVRQIKEREPDTEAFIRPQRTFADVVVTFYPPEAHALESGAALNVRQILRPTLPHPDLSPLIDGGSTGLDLTLARDTDGKPVDVLEIAGDIPHAKAERLASLMWSLIPEAGHMRDNVGAFESGGPKMSHPLALTQLLITYHMVKAAMGEHAV